MDNKKISGIWLKIGKVFNYMNWGVFVIQKFQFVVTWVILLKVFDAGTVYYIFTPIVILAVIFVIGIIWDRKVKEHFNNVYFGKGFKYDTQENISER